MGSCEVVGRTFEGVEAESSWGGDAMLRAEGRSGWMWRGWGVWFGRDE